MTTLIQRAVKETYFRKGCGFVQFACVQYRCIQNGGLQAEVVAARP